MKRLPLLALALTLAGCGPKSDQPSATLIPSAHAAEAAATGYPTHVYFGETHLHTINSGDAVMMGTRITPEDALRFGRGEKITSSTGVVAQLPRPLDFMVVSDHSELIGSGREILAGNPLLMADPTLRRWHDMMLGTRADAMKAARELIGAFSQGTMPAIMYDPATAKQIVGSVWQAHVATVERYNEPGKFTALMGYEYTSVPRGNNLHRIVIFRDGADKIAKTLPFSALESQNPEKLWAWFGNYEATTGGQVLAIPHNGNLSNGLMFSFADFDGKPMTADYARQRQKWEPLTEIVQAKGESEAHPFLSPNDEFADFGKAGWDIGNLDLSAPKTNDMYAGEYAREALKRGLLIEDRLGANPFKFGMIGAGDLHTGLSTSEQSNYMGETVRMEPGADRAMVAERRGPASRYAWQSLTTGLAAVWATSNTREGIFDAMERREVYATTGTRMSVRMFGGWDFRQSDFRSDWVKAGYARGVPMGGDLRPKTSAAPVFMISALKDAAGANLDRVQIVKGWVDKAGKAHERIFEVVWSSPGTRRIGRNGKLAPVGDTVDLATATYANSIGAPELRTVWRDPAFDPGQKAFYYARVLEIPTPRWPAYDAVRFGTKLAPEVIAKAQQRAYTSPIWYNPRG